LAEILDGKRLVHCHSYRQDEMLMLAMVAKDFKFRIGTYQHALEGYKVADYVRDWSGGASGFSDWWAYKVEVQDAIPAAFPIMAEQGVVVSFNSDSNELARHLNTEAAKAVKYGGVSEEEALKYVTLNPAKQLHIDARVGSIEDGKDADLALWSGSPLSAFSRCEATYVDGRCLFSIDQDKAMRDRVQKERLRLIQKLMNDGKKKPEAGASKDDGAKPAGGDDAPRDGRRRRGPRPPQLESEELLRQYYIELSNYGSIQEQGVCGCGLIHAQMR
jgi:N-acetylglucosamine-6-phosphate deacetylase